MELHYKKGGRRGEVRGGVVRIQKLEARHWKQKAGCKELEARSWMLESGGRKLEAGSWRPEAGGYLNQGGGTDEWTNDRMNEPDLPHCVVQECIPFGAAAKKYINVGQ